MGMKRELNEVTVCSVGTNCRPLTARALEMCNRQCKFADSIFFSDEPVEGSFRNLRVDPMPSISAYNTFVLKHLGKFVKTPFVLITQWDGYVVNSQAWSNDFLQYDYIGALWPWKEDEMRVGNGGFSLRSKKLLDVLAMPAFELLPALGEDEMICRAYRPLLEEKHAIRFAPDEVAERFSYERTMPKEPTFGFHGLMNFWREVSDSDLIRMVWLMPKSAFNQINCAQLAVIYYLSQRWRPLRALYGAWRAHFTAEEVQRQFVPAIPPESVADCLRICESLLEKS
jgi:hypothetical protein